MRGDKSLLLGERCTVKRRWVAGTDLFTHQKQPALLSELDLWPLVSKGVKTKSRASSTGSKVESSEEPSKPSKTLHHHHRLHTMLFSTSDSGPTYYGVYTAHAISLWGSGVLSCHMCISDVRVACWRHVCVFLLWVCCQGACGSLQEISPTLRHSL